MKLTDLNPHFIGSGGEGVYDKDGNPVPERHGVGIVFDCPCGGDCHAMYIPFTNPLDGGPPRDAKTTWNRTGTTFDDLSLTPSIQRLDNCKWHGYITNGQATNC